jgi:hypothetical protein
MLSQNASNSLFVLLVIKDALGITLDRDGEPSIDQLLGRDGSERGTVFEFLGFASEPELRAEETLKVSSA